MFNDTRLLVVDDEETICRGCRRILSPKGFRVETSNDARQALSLAVEHDYAVILLDMRMPQMDGIQFLEELRKAKPDVPVIVITGYPSRPNATSARRLGAADYIAKPFTPEQITQAVQRSLGARQAKREIQPSSTSPAAQPWRPAAQEFHFWGESWFQPIRGGAVRVGAMLPRARSGTVEAVWPPRVDWFVYQGLPLASATITGGVHLIVPAPVTGMVVASNELLFERPSALWDDPCGNGWIACIAPTRLEEEARHCKLRRLVLANADRTSADQQCARLTSLGCQVRVAGGLGEVGPALQQHFDCNVLVMDAASLGKQGPELARRINAAVPATKIVVIGSADPSWEAAYRDQRILYYAVEPFADDEIVDIVDAAFRPQAPSLPRAQRQKASCESISSICVTNPTGEKVSLLAEGSLLRQDDGLGQQIVQKLDDRHYCVEVTSGRTHPISSAIRQAEGVCDRVVMLLARDIGRLPGSLVREEFVPASSVKAREDTVLLVQPSLSDDPLGFDARTSAALAEQIVRETVWC